MDAKRFYSRLSKKQRAVIRSILEEGMSEYRAIEENKVRPCDYRRWLKSGHFQSEIDRYIESELRRKLFAITRTENGAAGRRACFELILLLKGKVNDDTKAEKEDELLDISDEQADRMLAILAEKEEKKI